MFFAGNQINHVNLNLNFFTLISPFKYYCLISWILNYLKWEIARNFLTLYQPKSNFQHFTT
ncbi:hypothetical protein MtrunA17_Chr5g0435851 [Medicago truncatula]|uniref:Transmembrane protein n=1 Tax=Medicago truncatula TaxID=3880 RepID=A0A396HYL8_MEDTR|nr:hypothetical protein MtrunA17_Chr5g0435851 [Medicago truncatula]